MKIFTMTAALGLLASSAAYAGGAVEPMVEVASPAPVFSPASHDWSGLYAGVSVSMNQGANDWTGDFYSSSSAALGPASSGSFDTDGNAAGIQAGYNMQYDKLVVGIEGDYNWGDIAKADSTATSPGLSLDQMGSLRGRLGYSSGQVLLYATAGWAAATGSMDLVDLTASGDNRAADISADGWTAGVGAEFALNDKMSIKAEYQNANLTMDESRFGNVAPASYFGANGTIDLQTLKVGFNYAF